MMELIDGSKNYISLVQQNYHFKLNSALCSLVTPPRCQAKKHMSMPADTQLKFCTPPVSKKASIERSPQKQGSVDRDSPSRMSPSQLFGKAYYAGAKFGERPLPAELPSPPNHWVSKNENWGVKEPSCIEMTNTLKVLLKVQS